ncbi:MAG: TraR/DksA family transcriptional regulator [Bacteriovoracaceae bacterium]|nr:TraR/DksA family transcriptional regulator [Bacteriovoracaceae bacterium]
MDQQKVEEFKTLFQDIKKNYSMNDFSLEDWNWDNKGDEVDQINDDRDKALLIKLKGRNDLFLKKVDQALFRIKQGTFGECLECGCDISDTRLRARPTATQCITCKEEQESTEKHMLYQKRSHTHGETFVNKNVIPMAFAEDRKEKEDKNVLKFNRERINLGLQH